MALTKKNTYGIGNHDLTNAMATIDMQRVGYLNIEIEESTRKVLSGSVLEIIGSLYYSPIDESITDDGTTWASIGENTDLYIYTDATNYFYSLTEPTKDSAKGAWYNGTDRCVAKGYKDAEGVLADIFYYDALGSLVGASTDLVQSTIHTLIGTNSTRKWYTIAQIEDGSAITKGGAEFEVKTKYYGRSTKFHVKVDCTTAWADSSLFYIVWFTPIAATTAIGWDQQDAYIKGRVVFDNTTGSKKGAVLQISLRDTSIRTDEEVHISMKKDQEFYDSVGWSLTSNMVATDTPALPDSTVYGSTEQWSEWLTSRDWVPLKYVHANIYPSVSYTSGMFTGSNGFEYSSIGITLGGAKLTNNYYQIESYIERRGSMNDTAGIYWYGWAVMNGTSRAGIVKYAALHTTAPGYVTVTTNDSTYAYINNIYGRNMGATRTLDSNCSGY